MESEHDAWYNRFYLETLCHTTCFFMLNDWGFWVDGFPHLWAAGIEGLMDGTMDLKGWDVLLIPNWSVLTICSISIRSKALEICVGLAMIFVQDEALDWLWVQPLDTWCIPKLLEDQTSKCSKRTNRDAKNTIVNLSISSKKNETINQISITWQFFVPFWGWLSDLQLGNQKVTLNHLERGVPHLTAFKFFPFGKLRSFRL